MVPILSPGGANKGYGKRSFGSRSAVLTDPPSGFATVGKGEEIRKKTISWCAEGGWAFAPPRRGSNWTPLPRPVPLVVPPVSPPFPPPLSPRRLVDQARPSTSLSAVVAKDRYQLPQ